MIAGRLAITMLVGWIFLSPVGHTSQPSKPDAARSGTVTLCQSGFSVDSHFLTRAARPATLGAFTPWRARLKSVLGETDHKIIVESDLGPALLPSRLIGVALLPLTPGHLQIAVPLRC